MNTANNKWKPKKNIGLIKNIQKCLKEAKEKNLDIEFLHVLGHKENVANQAADELAQLAAELPMGISKSIPHWPSLEHMMKIQQDALKVKRARTALVSSPAALG